MYAVSGINQLFSFFNAPISMSFTINMKYDWTMEVLNQNQDSDWSLVDYY